MSEIQIVFMICFGLNLVSKAILCDKPHKIPVSSVRNRGTIFVKTVNKTFKRKHRNISFDL
jgi:hypothetical protein